MNAKKNQNQISDGNNRTVFISLMKRFVIENQKRLIIGFVVADILWIAVTYFVMNGQGNL